MIPFSPPRMDQKIIDEVTATLKSGWITTGPRTKLFEKKLSAYIGNPSTLCVSSGSAGLELILRWFGVGPGDEVIVPAYTYSATANVVVHCGAKVVFVDAGRDFNLDVTLIRNLINERTKVIIPVDIAGLPCDYNELNLLVNQNGIKKYFNPATPEQQQLGRILLLADAAHSVGAIYKGKKTGTLADITVFSFHAVKNLTTAEGGAVCLNLPPPFENEKIYDSLNIKSLHGQTKDAMAKIQIGSWQYDVVEPGYKYNMTDIAAAMGLVELERYDKDMLIRRKHIFDLYTAAFQEHDWAELPEFQTAEKSSSYHVYMLRIKGINEEKRNRMIQSIFARDVAVNVHFIPLPMMTYYRNAGYDIKSFPVSYNNFSREITLPVYYDLTDDMVATIIKAVIDSVKENL